jgi:hypothetical protein
VGTGASEHMTFGVFMPPHHRVGQSPSLLLEQDLQSIELLDQLGYDEAWIGEHHSAGTEIIASPEVFIAAAAERTKHIRLGTGWAHGERQVRGPVRGSAYGARVTDGQERGSPVGAAPGSYKKRGPADGRAPLEG